MPFQSALPAPSIVDISEELRPLIDALPVLVAYLERTEEGPRYVFVNKIYESWFPTSRAEIQGRLVRDVVGEAAYARVQVWLEQALAGQRVSFEQFMPYAEGRHRTIQVEYVPRRDATGQVIGLYSLVQDISDTKRAEAALRDLNATLEAQVAERTAERDRAWRNSRDLLAVIGADGIFRAANPAWLPILGLAPEEVVGRHYRDFLWPEDAEPTALALHQAVGRQDLTGFENRYRHRDGQPRWISWNTSWEAELVYAYGRDVTAEKAQREALQQAEAQLRQAQKLEVVGQLTGGVAHDFNNLLTIIRSSVDLLRRPNLSEERRSRYVAAIAETVDRAARLTGQLLAFARRQALKPEVFDPAEHIRTIAEMMRTVVGARVHILMDLSPETCSVEADASQFETALVNMVVNARDAMDGEGTLVLRLRPLSAMPSIRGHLGTGGSFVAISITDTGVGIAPESLTKIFEPFYTTKPVGHGTGLGLSQVYGFAKQSGGDVAVESEPGRGTTFTLYLPRAQEKAQVALASEAGGPIADGRGCRVLVVEDNAEVGAFSSQLLQDLGYETCWAANAEQALTLLARDRFDAVFTDVVMPGVSGIELGEEIRRRYPGLPVVLTSGYSHILAAEGRHGFELLQKPYAAEELSRVLRRVTQPR
ncbi:hybrid sensor histidine kinase/response regulator [Falsiroseomonas tokyonensis]|uniref:histidine kinase n=1 Tax=Falsiroseomonas tokyonensis TaxID=430521 RepID=A0ABV7BS79_9PROT|nr:PAS domain-containing sensor histidine kinase [Falsiroseomonas tokyonensis]MBU8538492.1 PAS domain-containing protein [Falsiroseomonas tokyonensis]